MKTVTSFLPISLLRRYNRISVAKAKRLCPELVLVRGDNGVNGMQRYREAAQGVLRCIMTALDQVAGVASAWRSRAVEKASFDDFYVELPPGSGGAGGDERGLQGQRGDAALGTVASAGVGAPAAAGPAEKWAVQLQGQVRSATGLRCSIGIARTKLLAMLATKRAKRDPTGIHCCPVAAESTMLSEARVDAIRGAGLVGLPPGTRATLLGAVGTRVRPRSISVV